MREGVKGKLEVICGSMFSGKSEELLYRLRRSGYAKKKVLIIKPSIDIRKSVTKIVCHSGEHREAFPIENCEEGLHKILNLADSAVDVIGIDEIQFFPPETISMISTLLNRGKRVILAGLDLDFRGEPFGIMPSLLALADEVVKLRAICVCCGEEANFSQRLINGHPAKYDDPIVLIGGGRVLRTPLQTLLRNGKRGLCPAISSLGPMKHDGVRLHVAALQNRLYYFFGLFTSRRISFHLWKYRQPER